eukprot:GHVQ01025045.1.p1 GENE.GHVQ01025045.1~~GHVQ01025045.1.p1  ORF type:complete len:287 (+),score=23.99 GHVQ01025045.1:153-1013(+)
MAGCFHRLSLFSLCCFLLHHFSTAYRLPPKGLLSPYPSSTYGRANLMSSHKGVSRSTRFSTTDKQHFLDGRPLSGPIVPLYDRVVALPKDSAKTTSGGLLLPTDSRQKLSCAKVLTVGTGYVNQQSGARMPMDIQEGDWILYDSNDGQTMDYDNSSCVVLGSREVLAVLQDSTDGTLSPDKVRPLLDLVMLKLQRNEDKTASGLFLSMGDKAGAFNGKVVAAGNGGFDVSGKRIPMEVSVGDMVRIAPYAYQGGEGRQDREIKVGDDKYVFVRISDLVVKWSFGNI